MNSPVHFAIIGADGSFAARYEALPLARMQELVGGDIDVVGARGPDAREGLHLVVNDVGLVDGLPINVAASSLYYSADYPTWQRFGIRGDAIVIRVDDEGETANLTPADETHLIGLTAVRR